jgi:hypothetical protein
MEDTMKIYRGIKNHLKETGIIDFDKLTISEPYIEGGSINLSCGTLSGNWYEAQATDQGGNQYTVIWAKVDFDADGADACDWDNPDYILNDSGYDFVKEA